MLWYEVLKLQRQNCHFFAYFTVHLHVLFILFCCQRCIPHCFSQSSCWTIGKGLSQYLQLLNLQVSFTRCNVANFLCFYWVNFWNVPALCKRNAPLSYKMVPIFLRTHLTLASLFRCQCFLGHFADISPFVFMELLIISVPGAIKLAGDVHTLQFLPICYYGDLAR